METDLRFRCWACGSLCISRIPTANGSVHSATCCQHRPSSSCMTQHSKLYKITTPKKFNRLLALFLFLFFFHHPIIAANRFLFADQHHYLPLFTVSHRPGWFHWPKDSRIIHWGMANTESSPRHVLYLKLGWPQHLKVVKSSLHVTQVNLTQIAEFYVDRKSVV